jgi:hypothetical protein
MRPPMDDLLIPFLLRTVLLPLPRPDARFLLRPMPNGGDCRPDRGNHASVLSGHVIVPGDEHGIIEVAEHTSQYLGVEAASKGEVLNVSGTPSTVPQLPRESRVQAVVNHEDAVGH